MMTATPTVKGNYLTVTINNKRRRIHILVATVFHENPDNLPEVDHIDHDTTNNMSTNLRWSSKKSNIDHRTLNGKKKKVRAHFTREECLYIHSMKRIKSSTILAAELNCQPDGISKVWRGVGKKNTKHKIEFYELKEHV